MKCRLLVVFILMTNFIYAQTSTDTQTDPKEFKTTSEQGMSKFERLEYFDSYLKTISESVKSLDSKMDSQSKKIKILDESILSLKSDLENLKQTKNADTVMGNKKSVLKDSPNSSDQDKNSLSISADEIAKMKQEIETFKIKDLAKLRSQINNLSDTVEAVQATLRSK